MQACCYLNRFFSSLVCSTPTTRINSRGTSSVMKLIVLPDLLTVIKYPPSSSIPTLVLQTLQHHHTFIAVTKTTDELSIVLPSLLANQLKTIEGGIKFDEEDGFRGLRISGQLDFSLIGVIYGLSKILAEEKIGIFVVSTFNTDYIMVKKDNLERAIAALQQHGHEIVEEQ